MCMKVVLFQLAEHGYYKNLLQDQNWNFYINILFFKVEMDGNIPR